MQAHSTNAAQVISLCDARLDRQRQYVLHMYPIFLIYSSHLGISMVSVDPDADIWYPIDRKCPVCRTHWSFCLDMRTGVGRCIAAKCKVQGNVFEVAARVFSISEREAVQRLYSAAKEEEAFYAQDDKEGVDG